MGSPSGLTSQQPALHGLREAGEAPRPGHADRSVAVVKLYMHPWERFGCHHGKPDSQWLEHFGLLALV